MTAPVIDGHIADFNVRRAIGPLAHMECANHNITPQNCHQIRSSPDELHFLFAMNGDILTIVARLDEDRVTFLGSIHRFLKRDIVPGSIQRHHKGPRAKSWPFISPHRANAPEPDRCNETEKHDSFHERDRKSTRLNSSHGYISY